ncbi:hypothetical protein U1Q18_021052 [Sarracenia purpurea var. burkii]
MKSRSHRLPTSDPPDDWVDGSWTVDCVCGVNFDDGEEMVNCDECGVWVHTRCSRYVKSEKSFACDKCKSKNSRNDNEETEVAQLLVELPTKTLTMGNPYPPSGLPRRPFRLWTDIPIEERVHTQGIPGGEPALFTGLTSVFTPELWKCTGYVPKKFNFQYREFPFWDEEQGEVNAKVEEENENPVDKGAGVLFSLSKDNVMPIPVATLSGMKRQVDEGGCDRLLPSKNMNKWEDESRDVSCPQNSVKKDRTLLRPLMIHSSKRKKEDSGTSKDRSGKVRDREGDPKKRALRASRTASEISNAKQLEFFEDRDPKIVKTDTQSTKNADFRDTLPNNSLPANHHVVEHPSDVLVSDVSGHNFPTRASSLEEKFGNQVSARTEDSSKIDEGMASLLERNDPGNVPVKEEVVGVGLDNATGKGGGYSIRGGFDSCKSGHVDEDFSNAVGEGRGYQNSQGPNVDMCPSTLKPTTEVKMEADLDNSRGAFNVVSSTIGDVKLDGTLPLALHLGASTGHLSVNVNTNDTSVTTLQFSDLKVQGGDSSTELASNCVSDVADEFPSDPSQPNQQVVGLKSSIAAGKSSLEVKHDLGSAEESSKLSSMIVIPRPPSSQRKMAASSSVSSTILISKHSVPDSRKPSNAQSRNPFMKRGMSDCTTSIKKDNSSTNMVRSEARHEMPRKILKECSKSPFSSVLKVSHSGKISHAPDSKKTVSDSKDHVLHLSSKASSAQKIGITSGSGEPSSSLQAHNASHVQSKILPSGLPQRGEKLNQSNSPSSTKVSHTVPMHPHAPSNSPATLSDEELALLLHQELNSSPRVPRVPRMRHTGSLPQLGSPTATSMLIKQTSSSGGRDYSVVARRKAKDLPKHGSHCSREIDDEGKMDRLVPSSDPRRHDLASAVDGFTKREADSSSGKGVYAVKKSAPSASAVSLCGGPSSSTEANEQIFSSMCNSPRNTSDDDTGTIRGPTHRTLPGLIAEIMSKGKRMTYEELCGAVLPHWPNLRKHNGERYAYSSHSQAVLDCLRNRHEWAQLVDRGPKTNAGRKRRKLDAEAPGFESDDDEYGKDTTAKEVESKSFESHREEFPKGKRKARKRGQLALRGRHIKDVRRRRKADVLSDDDDDDDDDNDDNDDDDDDDGSFSSSGEVSMFSDDEIQGGGGSCPVGSEAFASSDEMGSVP